MSKAILSGILWHLVGAASAACFYALFKKARQCSWETMWSVGGIMSWNRPALDGQRHSAPQFLGLLQHIFPVSTYTDFLFEWE
ncbi:L-rhamnose/proton symporter RhaT [Erwinia tracheiphila]|uniref:Uncharacterized protein n=1 Tax=Erwinia tracheiphila TaxID=65700 RepID=A0A0M2KBR2_9GAMM|nr:l-rhamnose-proton symporter [Erwinia tracheiphila]EOS96888.1 L-rhamnose-proton symporter [Erwinia tracheiphila PSU-1]KKF34683.1 hypothetical protein SY86_03275 [Erwinia tracheiphila]UIA86355.1 L-rhamnose/proton symporter RhaT [Erwinia tracheiphila]UIA94675.1 L-rhamnose/proton symporter RhaT [Erwinia tracheiphila]